MIDLSGTKNEANGSCITLMQTSLPDTHAKPAFCDENELRTSFASAMSAMYKSEVPQYGDLVRIVQEVNQQVCQEKSMSPIERLDLERHGAIRLGTPQELHTIRRIFALIGLYPVDYYDLSAAGLPMHATAFRPLDVKALSRNPFRVFTTLLRPELLKSEPRELAMSLLQKRNIFSNELLRLLSLGEAQGGLTRRQGEQFVTEAMQTFKWHSVAVANQDDYEKLAAEHPILADVACFNSAHINHLTPRTLDIDLAETRMREEGLAVKPKIEGPPARRNPILLRQTSFLALEEQVSFPTKDLKCLVQGHHKARFGEIEQRGAAVTPKGRLLYDQILSKALRQMQAMEGHSSATQEYDNIFRQYPDDWNTLVKDGLVYIECRCTGKAKNWTTKGSNSTMSLATLLDQEIVEAIPITYEDFLPFSAAGIFRSNLQSSAGINDDDTVKESFHNREGLEIALGCQVFDSDALYADIQRHSMALCAKMIGVGKITSNAD